MRPVKRRFQTETRVEEPLREGGVLSAARGKTAIPELWVHQNEAKSGWKVIRTWQ